MVFNMSPNLFQITSHFIPYFLPKFQLFKQYNLKKGKTIQFYGEGESWLGETIGAKFSREWREVDKGHLYEAG